MVMRTIQDDDDDDNMHVIRNDVYEKRSGRKKRASDMATETFRKIKII